MKRKLMYAAVILFLLQSAGCESGAKSKALSMYLAASEEYAKDNLPAAKNYLLSALKHDKKFYEARFLYGKILFFEDNYKEARNTFAAVIKNKKEHTEARLWNIRCLILLGEFESAEDALKTELSFNPGDWRVYYQYAFLEAARGNSENRLALLKDGENYLKDGSRLYLELAKIWQSLRMRGKALEYLNRAALISGEGVMGKSITALKKRINENGNED